MKLESVLLTLHIQLLGDYGLVYGESTVAHMDSPRQQSLLAYLVLHRAAPQSRQHLAFLFWPDSTESQARNNLRQSLHLLKHALPEAITFSTSTRRRCSGCPMPLSRSMSPNSMEAIKQAESATALQHAASLYGGELLPGCIVRTLQIQMNKQLLETFHV